MEKRQHFCTEELLMNRRRTPEIYLEVLPIFQKGDRFYLGSSSTSLNASEMPVEWTLKMREFPQDCLFTSLLERGELTEEIMEKLRREVAQFHSTANSNESEFAHQSQLGRPRRFGCGIDVSLMAQRTGVKSQHAFQKQKL